MIQPGSIGPARPRPGPRAASGNHVQRADASGWAQPGAELAAARARGQALGGSLGVACLGDGVSPPATRVPGLRCPNAWSPLWSAAGSPPGAGNPDPGQGPLPGPDREVSREPRQRALAGWPAPLSSPGRYPGLAPGKPSLPGPALSCVSLQASPCFSPRRGGSPSWDAPQHCT